MNSENDLFIERMINVIRGHTAANLATETEKTPKTSLWHVTTPREYLREVIKAYGEYSEKTVREAIHRALNDGLLDRALFLIIVLCRLSEYIEMERKRRPWNFSDDGWP